MTKHIHLIQQPVLDFKLVNEKVEVGIKKSANITRTPTLKHQVLSGNIHTLF